MDEQWEIWFHAPGRALSGGALTVDSQLRASLRRLTRVPVTRKSLEEMEAQLADEDRMRDKRVVVISHVDLRSDDELHRLARVTNILRRLPAHIGQEDPPVHFSLIHQDPTSANEDPSEEPDEARDHEREEEPEDEVENAQALREKITRHVSTFDRVVCIGPRMRVHLRSQWPLLVLKHLIELGAGMAEPPREQLVFRPMLRSMPRKSNVRVLFGSPTSPSAMKRRGLDVFARAAGLVQSHFVEKHVDVTFVVSGIVPDQPRGPSGRVAQSRQDHRDLLQFVERQLLSWAGEEFDGLTEFEVRELQGRTAWLEQELERADIFVLPSREEPFGLVAAEALSMGKPVIVTQNTGIGESLLDFAADSFLPVDRYVCALTPSALARSIETVIEDDRSRALFHRISNDVYSRLSWANAVHQILNEVELPEKWYKPTAEFSAATECRIGKEFLGAVTRQTMVVPIGSAVPEGGVQYNMPFAWAGPLEEFDSNSGRQVTLETNGSTLFIRKRVTESDSPQDSPSIASVTRQWTFVNKALEIAATASPSLRGLYPAIYLEDDRQVLMEYVDGGSLDRVTDLAEATRLTGLATVQLLQAVVASGEQLPAKSAWDFGRDELDRRIARLDRSMATLAEDERHALSRVPDLVRATQVFFEARKSAAEGDPITQLAVHGDFGLNNVVFRSDAQLGDRMVFVDTRARWDESDGTPRWDVAFDLASLYIFTVDIQRVLSQEFGYGVTSPLHGRKDDLVTIIERAVKESRFAETDVDWRPRVEAACAVRLLGSVGAQLSSARSRRVERAVRMAELAFDFVMPRAEPAITWRGLT